MTGTPSPCKPGIHGSMPIPCTSTVLRNGMGPVPSSAMAVCVALPAIWVAGRSPAHETLPRGCSRCVGLDATSVRTKRLTGRYPRQGGDDELTTIHASRLPRYVAASSMLTPEVLSAELISFRTMGLAAKTMGLAAVYRGAAATRCNCLHWRGAQLTLRASGRTCRTGSLR